MSYLCEEGTSEGARQVVGRSPHPRASPGFRAGVDRFTIYRPKLGRRPPLYRPNHITLKLITVTGCLTLGKLLLIVQHAERRRETPWRSCISFQRCQKKIRNTSVLGRGWAIRGQGQGQGRTIEVKAKDCPVETVWGQGQGQGRSSKDKDKAMEWCWRKISCQITNINKKCEV